LPRTRDELVEALAEQRGAIRASGASFDEGELWEAKRLAAAVYVLVHDGKGRTKSLLTQLGVRASLRFLSTAKPLDPKNLLTEHSLVSMRVEVRETGSRARYRPAFDLYEQLFAFNRLQFLSWWEEPVIRDNQRRVLSRKNIVFSLRDQEGGAHFDEELRDEVYKSLVKENSAGWVVQKGDVMQPVMPGPHLATMRQIAWELERTLENANIST
jgi:hypothetical protein